MISDGMLQRSDRGSLPRVAMRRSQKRLGYVIAICSTIAVLLARIALDEALVEQARLMPFVLSVMAAAWWGGLGPGLLATGLGLVLGVFFIVPPDMSLEITNLSDGLNAIIFVFVGATISYLCAALHDAWRNEAEKQFRSLADSMPQLVWMARPNGYRFWFNQRWFEYTGARLEQAVGNGWQSFCDPTQLSWVIKSWQASVNTGEAWEETYPLRRKDGRMRWHLARAVPVCDPDGEIVCWFGTSTDIEDRVVAEQALKDAGARKDQFLATLAHELRSPLSPISNALQLLPRVMNDRTELEQLRTVMEQQVQQLLHLIDDLLDLSRITQGRIHLHLEPVELGSLVSRAIEEVQPVIDAASQRLLVTLPEQPIYVQGDAERLSRVFGNMLNNAAKFSDSHGQIAISVRKQNNQSVVTIRDNGQGIPAHLQSEIFEAFRPLDPSIGSAESGLGISLWLVRQLVELHGGTVTAHSDGPGTGSEFVVTIPALPALSAAGDGANQPSLRKPVRGAARRRILVVDSQRETGETLAEVLQTIGHEATSLVDSRSVMQWVLVNHPDLVLLAPDLPSGDGYAIARALRGHRELRETFLAALLPAGDPDAAQRALAAGFHFSLTKPVTTSALEVVLNSLPSRQPATETVSLLGEPG